MDEIRYDNDNLQTTRNKMENQQNNPLKPIILLAFSGVCIITAILLIYFNFFHRNTKKFNINSISPEMRQRMSPEMIEALEKVSQDE